MMIRHMVSKLIHGPSYTAGHIEAWSLELDDASELREDAKDEDNRMGYITEFWVRYARILEEIWKTKMLK